MHKALGVEVVLGAPPVVVERGKPLNVVALKAGGVIYGRIADP